MTEPTPSSLTLPPKKHTARIVRTILILVVLAGSLWYALNGMDWGAFWHALTTADLAWILAGVAFNLLAHVARAERWRLLIPNGKSVKLWNAFSATIIGYMLNNVLPRSGEIARPYVLAKREKRSMSALVGTVVVERILDGVMLSSILVILLFIARDQLGMLIPGYTATGIFLTIAIPIAALVAFVLITAKTTFGDRVMRAIARRLPARAGERLLRLLEEFRTGLTMGESKHLLPIMLWSVAIWTGYALTFGCGFYAFGLIGHYGMGPGAALMVEGITSAGVAIAPTPGAFGVFHSFCRVVLVNLYGVPLNTAIAYALAMHGAPYVVVTSLGGLFALRENISLSAAAHGGEEKEPAVEANTPQEIESA